MGSNSPWDYLLLCLNLNRQHIQLVAFVFYKRLGAYSDSIKVMNFGQIRERSVLFLIIIDLKAGLLFLFLLKLGYIQ